MNALKYTPPETDQNVKSEMCSGYYGDLYPEFTLKGEQVKALFGSETPSPGQVYETEVQLKITAWEAADKEANKPGRVTVQVIACESCEGASETDEDSDEDPKKD